MQYTLRTLPCIRRDRRSLTQELLTFSDTGHHGYVKCPSSKGRMPATEERKRSLLMSKVSTEGLAASASIPDLIESARFEVRFGYEEDARQVGNELLQGSVPRRHSSSRRGFVALYPEVRLPKPGSLTSVPPWTRGGQSSLGAHNCGVPIRRQLKRDGASPTEAAARQTERKAAVQRWRAERRAEGESWREETRWYAQGDPPPRSYLERTDPVYTTRKFGATKSSSLPSLSLSPTG